MSRLIDLSHVVEHGMVTYKGLPPPFISEYLSREESREHFAASTEFHIGKIEMAANTGTCIDSPFHRFVNGKDLSGLQLDSVANLNSLVIRQTKRNTRRIEPDMLKGKKLRNKAVLVHTGWDRQMIDTHRWTASCTKSPERCHPASLRGT